MIKHGLLTLTCLVSWMLMSFVPMPQTSSYSKKYRAAVRNSLSSIALRYDNMPMDSILINPNTSDSVLIFISDYLEEIRSFQVMNDSMYMGLDSAEWIPFFKRRASLLSNYYRTNSLRVRTIKKLLDATQQSDISEFSDTMAYNPVASLMTNARCRLVQLLYELTFYDDQHTDAFLFEDLLEYIGPDLEKYMPHSVYTYLYYSTLWRCKYLIASVADDGSLEEAWRYNQKILDMDQYVWKFTELWENLVFPYTLALFNSLDLRYAYEGVTTLDEIRANVQHVEDVLNTHREFFEREEEVNNRKRLHSAIATFPMRILTQYVWKDNYDYHSSVSDSAAQVYIDRLQRKPRLEYTDSVNMWKMQVYLGQLDPNVAREHTYSYDTAHVFNRYHDITRKNVMACFANNLFPLLYFNDRSSVSESEKQRCAAQVAEQIVLIMRACKNAQSGDVKAVLASHYLTLPILINHLTPQERSSFLNDVFVSCQVQTVTHSNMVSKLSSVLLSGVMTYEPELLEGLPMVPSVRKLKRSKQLQAQLLHFMEEGAFCHDLGKITMAEIVRNDFRPLTDHEFAIIKTHPERGVKFLHIDPTKVNYQDLLVGHHKWYDSKRGYPDRYNTITSPYRILVDIVTISDCLEAATDQLGRRYSNAKKFDMMMQEFRSGAGTRYNADLVRLIDAHPDVADRLRYMVEQGWYGNYYEIYHKYFSEDYGVSEE